MLMATIGVSRQTLGYFAGPALGYDISTRL